MRLWRSTRWKITLETLEQTTRKGLRFRFDNNVDQEVRRSCILFGHWLRSEFYFPIRVTVYFKSKLTIRAMDGEEVSAIFFEPFSKSDEPYIRIATGDYYELSEKWGKDNALGAILGSLGHELTHYFQWLNDVNSTDLNRERQADRYRQKILNMYSQIQEHP